ncbi:hypothetical protein [Hymenobacter baengnokdamensis]|uniref:hypothetical protein n=1 Tax=Hymenobacter baengnokdamensis TaxID=2615203 RepID=UPI0012455BAA|nr:hypothetical protein [Hymenobacter baengnokdamensis]
MIDNSRLDWQDKSKFRKALDSLVTMNAANQLQEHLLEEIARAEITEKAELRQLITKTIRETPEFFSDTWYGRQEVDSCWHTSRVRKHPGFACMKTMSASSKR